MFVIKFYVQQHSKSEYKFSKLTNKGDLSNILMTNAKLIPILLNDFPGASFGFIGSRSIDVRSRKVEGYELNQRFRVYRNFVSEIIGTETFEHYEYEEISAYLLVNKINKNIGETEREIVSMFTSTYRDLTDI